MDGNRFDELVRELLAGASRRSLLLRLSALPLAGGLPAFFLDDESAAKKRKKKKRKKKERKEKKREKREPKVDCSAAGVCASGCPFASLQQAIDEANNGDTITLCAETYAGTLTIDKVLTLVGAGEDATTLQGDGTGSVVTITDGTVRIENLRITGGAGAEYGGGIYNQAGATLTLSGCTISGNNVDDGYGNGIANEGTLTVEDCTISGNGLDAPGFPWGGGIHTGSGGILTVTNSVISGNRANSGGALYDEFGDATTLTGCDLSDNVVFGEEAEGGAITSFDLALQVTDCTIRNNSGAVNGGGASILRTAVFTDCEISGNSASEQGGGIYNFYGEGVLTLDNTEVAGNSAGTTGGGIFNAFGTVSCINGSTVRGNTGGDCVDSLGGSGCNTCAP